MIPINELRIGNYAYYGKRNSIGKIIMFLGTQTVELDEAPFLDYEEDFIDIDISEINSIPLTKDRLREFRFKKDKSNFINDSYVNKELKLTIIIREDKFFLTSFFGWVELKYVHKMQNLCFELTGKELTL
jgi:hypothetical protein